MPDNRIETTVVANAATDAALAPVSPTGTALIPSRFVPFINLALAVGGIPAALSLIPSLGIPAAVAGAGVVLTVIATWALANSPGLRKQA